MIALYSFKPSSVVMVLVVRALSEFFVYRFFAGSDVAGLFADERHILSTHVSGFTPVLGAVSFLGKLCAVICKVSVVSLLGRASLHVKVSSNTFGLSNFSM